MSILNLPGAISAECLHEKIGEQKLPFCKKLKYAITHITLEPLILLFILGTMMTDLSYQNLAMEKACRVNLNFSASICDALVVRNRSAYNLSQEAEVQQLVTKWTAYKSIVAGTIPVFLMMFLGSWSDRNNRRKPIILMPIIGVFIAALGLLLCSYYFLELSMEYAWFFQTFPPALFGGGCCAGMGIYSYVSSKCSDEDRTIKIGAVAMCATIGMSLGMFLSGILLNRLGFQAVYILAASLILIGFVYGMLVIKDEQPEKVEKKKKGLLKDMFALEHIKNTVTVCFREGEGNRRIKMIVIMILCMLIHGPLQGEITVVYMYIRLKCGWNEVDYSVYNSAHFIIQLLGNSFSLSFFSKYLKMSDAMLGVIAIISRMCSCTIYAFAPSGIYFYIAACIDLFHGTSFIAVRALMSKIVPAHELGQSNSVFGIFDAITPLCFGFVYTKIYINTLTFFPGFFYLVTISIYSIALGLFIWLDRQGKKEIKIKLVKQETELEKSLLGKNYPMELKKSLETLKT